ncbi:MAG: T9SS type A sorting domain-containing protein [Bacteroidia bacterium]
MSFAAHGWACNLSQATFCGITTTPLIVPGYPNDSVICIQLCSGYGRTGNVYGAGGDTRSILFGWYDHNPGFLIRGFTPATITSQRPTLPCTMPGYDIGAQGPPTNSQGTVLYADPGYYGILPCSSYPYGCISTTVPCGNVAQQCVTFRFQVNQIPDSMRVFGVEGGGNPLAGCYPDADMLVNFIVLPVTWGDVEAIHQEKAVRVRWSTIRETNTDFFLVSRSTGTGDFEQLGIVKAAGNSTGLESYSFVDLAPANGTNRYRVQSIDLDGGAMTSPIVEANFSISGGLQWGAIGPVPAHDFVHMTYYAEQVEMMNLRIFDAAGKTVFSKETQSEVGANELRLTMSNLDAGVYYVSLQGGSGKLMHKVIKL